MIKLLLLIATLSANCWAQATKIVVVGKLVCGARRMDAVYLQTWCNVFLDNGTSHLMINSAVWLVPDKNIDLAPNEWQYDEGSKQVIGGSVSWRFRLDSTTDKVAWSYVAKLPGAADKAGSGVFP